MSDPRSVLLKVFRSGPGGRARHYDEFRVPVGPRATVRPQLPRPQPAHEHDRGGEGRCAMDTILISDRDPLAADQEYQHNIPE
jgi:hypothetical protein